MSVVQGSVDPHTGVEFTKRITTNTDHTDCMHMTLAQYCVARLGASRGGGGGGGGVMCSQSLRVRASLPGAWCTCALCKPSSRAVHVSCAGFWVGSFDRSRRIGR